MIAAFYVKQMTLAIIYQDEHFVAINKPSGLLVHRSWIDRHETRFALQMTRDLVGQHVFPVHRLDKPTSGVLLFALDSDSARLVSEQFSAHSINKKYLAIVRGYAPEHQIIDYPLKEQLDKIADKKADKNKEPQSAITQITRLASCELPYAVDKYPSSRYSLLLAEPQTGRKHQIRRHLKHISHPIIGDAKHGKSSHNRFFARHFDSQRLLLAAIELSFFHPYKNTPTSIKAELSADYMRVIQRLGWQDALPASLGGHTPNPD